MALIKAIIWDITNVAKCTNLSFNCKTFILSSLLLLKRLCSQSNKYRDSQSCFCCPWNRKCHLCIAKDFNVVKCNLGKVNLEAMLVSCFPSYSRGGPMPLAGAPCDLYTQLLAWSSSQSVVAIACCLQASLCFSFFPSLPPSWGMG